MNVKHKVATAIALKAFEQVNSSQHWEDIFIGEMDWKEIDKLVPDLDIDNLIEELDINHPALDKLINEVNEQIDREIELLKQSEIRS